MYQSLTNYYQEAIAHQVFHGCGGVPYQHGDMLTTFVDILKPARILEVGTGIGYSTACLAMGNKFAEIDTIDKDKIHLALARKEWKNLEIANQIASLEGKAEGILLTLTEQYDFIFYDGYVPQNKIYVAFERLLKKNGVLVTANLYLHDKTGGNYLRKLQNTKKWQTVTFADTAISVKLF